MHRVATPPRARLDSVSRVHWSLALPPPPSPHVRRRRRSGARRAHAPQRRRAGAGSPCLPVRGLAGDRQDEHGEDPRRLPELRRGSDDEPVREVRFVRGDRQRHVARRDRDGRRVEQLSRRHSRPAGEGRLRPGLGAAQGVHPRRGAHALSPGVERVPEDARGAAAADDLRAGDDRGAEGAADGRRSLPPLRLRKALPWSRWRPCSSGSPARRRSTSRRARWR